MIKAFLSFDAVIRERKLGKRSELKFKSKKSPKQAFMVQKLTKRFMKKNFKVSEELPEEAFGKLTTFSYESGRWYVCAQIHIKTQSITETQGLKVVSVDPGVRTFATTYSGDSVLKYGDGFFDQKVYPLLLKLDFLLSQRDRSKNDQWKRGYEKKIKRLRWRISDLIRDLHYRVAYDLVMSYDIILLPTFETQEMSIKKNRKIRKKTVRAMLGLSHYKFKTILKWMARKYGKRVVDVCEAYTSKTRSWDGYIEQKLGGSKTIKDDKVIVDRDVNGARGIMLRTLYGT